MFLDALFLLYYAIQNQMEGDVNRNINDNNVCHYHCWIKQKIYHIEEKSKTEYCDECLPLC